MSNKGWMKRIGVSASGMKPAEGSTWRLCCNVAFVVALGFVLVVNSAVPFFVAPTLGQAVWLTGFSQAFSLDNMRTIYSSYVGYPSEMWIPFGLPIAYPAGFLIYVGMRAIDAYSAVVAVWLSLAFWGAYRYAGRLGLEPGLSILAAVLWMSLPIVWAHAGYSGLSVGIALIPFYIYVASQLFSMPARGMSSVLRLLSTYVFVCTVSLFMDGYSFMMFVVGASLIFCYFFISSKHLQGYLIKVAMPIHVVGLVLAYSLYVVYVGRMTFDSHPLDFFRGWGADLIFWVIPTRGIQWFWDALGLSVPRSDIKYFGDESVWNTTFLLPLIIAGFSSWWAVRRKKSLAYGLIVLTLIGLYLALGPSLKIDSVKPEVMDSSMPAQYAIGPTGSAFLFEHIPGFTSMRATYRWSALGAVGLWALLVLWAGTKTGRRGRMWVACLFLILIVMYIPHLKEGWVDGEKDRNSFNLMVHDVVQPLSHDLKKGELVAFLPFRNDFLVNYLAPKLQIRTYNIGGDKQLAAATVNWKSTMRHFRLGVIDRKFAGRVELLLARRQADVVVLPYIDLLWAAHSWPYPIQYRGSLAPVIKALKDSGLVDIVDRKYYAAVRLTSRSRVLAERGELAAPIINRWCFGGGCLRQIGFSDSSLSQVGRLVDDKVVADGRPGFLAFGPYAFVKKGRYRLEVFGSSGAGKSAWCDVVSNAGATEYGKFVISTNHHGRVLAQGHIVLDHDVRDLEVRVYVGKDDVVTLRGYELVPEDVRAVTS